MGTKKLLVICLSFVVVSLVGYQMLQRKTERELQSAGFRGYCPDCVFKNIYKDVSKLIKLVDHNPNKCESYNICRNRTEFGPECCTNKIECTWSKKDKSCFHCPRNKRCYDKHEQRCCESDPTCHWDSSERLCSKLPYKECIQYAPWYQCCNRGYTCRQPNRRCCERVKKIMNCDWYAEYKHSKPKCHSSDFYLRRSCFKSGTLITLANGDLKPIQNLKIGDKVIGSSGVNTVLKLRINHHEGLVYSFNGSRYFVTGGHPFMTTEGWKAFDLETAKELNPDLDFVDTLKEGDILIKANDKKEKLIKYSSQIEETTVYNLKVDGDSAYYANGYLVHNK